MPLAAGTRLGVFEILAPLGKGGMGEVYRARDTKLDREVAVKILPEEMAKRPERLARFEREAKALAALDHPGIVTVHSVEEAEGVHFLTMQLVGGRPLGRLIPEGGMPLERILDIATTLAEALDAAHKKGIVHRDLKPANVMVGDDGRVKILDFGLAKLTDPRTGGRSEFTTLAETREGVVLGTMPYMSPEQVEGRAVDHRSDIFSLGVILYEMATGRRPFRADSTAGLISAILRDSPASVTDLRRDLPVQLDRIIGRCLVKDPHQRLQSSLDLRGELNDLAQDSESRASSRVPVTGADASSIAVLPLANLSGDPSQEYFADGMTEALITDLAKIRALKVISRTSVMRYKGTQKPLPTIARELNVDAVVEGSVLRVGDQVRISAQLIHAASDTHLWAESYDRNFRDILSLQKDVARGVVEGVRVTLSPEEQRGLTTSQTVDTEVYEAVLKGRFHTFKGTSRDVEAAFQWYRRALAKDPDSAPAHAGLALAYLLLGVYGDVTPEVVMPGMQQSARRAVDLDDSLADAHMALSAFELFFGWDWDASERESRRAVALNPNLALALGLLGWNHLLRERQKEALTCHERAVELDPVSPFTNSELGLFLLYTGEVDRAIDHLHRTLELERDFWRTHWVLGMALTARGDFDRAIDACSQAVFLSAGNASAEATLAIGYAMAGDRERAVAARENLLESRKRRYVRATMFGAIETALGDYDRAFQWLDAAVEERAPLILHVKVTRWFAPLRDDPRYVDLLRRIGLD